MNTLFDIAIAVVLVFLTAYVLYRIVGTAVVILGFFFTMAVYAIPVIFTLFFGLTNPWLLIICVPLSIGYYFLVTKIRRKWKERKIRKQMAKYYN